MQPAVMKSYELSARYYEESCDFLPGGVSSNFRLGMEPFPLCFARASGSMEVDLDGNEYIDYALGMGPVILGHAHPAVNAAVQASLSRGQLYGGQNELELRLAREIHDLVPCAEMVRFSLSGSEAVQAALRLARAYTGRCGIIKFEGHYHGWFDNIFVSVQADPDLIGPASAPHVVPMSPGQEPGAYAETRILPWNDLPAFSRALEQYGDEIAGVIMEPILCNTSAIRPKPGYLEAIRELCTRYGIVLIFDEVITGFRVALGGAQKLLGVTPDLAVFAKAMANGFPISCLAGSRRLMEMFDKRRVMHGGTYNTNVVSCAAACATLEELKNNGGEVYERMERIGSSLMEELRKIGAEMGVPLRVQGLPAVFHTPFTDQEHVSDYRSYRCCRLDLQEQFVSRLLENGVRITARGTWFISAAHSERDVEVTLRAAKAALRSMF